VLREGRETEQRERERQAEEISWATLELLRGMAETQREVAEVVRGMAATQRLVAERLGRLIELGEESDEEEDAEGAVLSRDPPDLSRSEQIPSRSEQIPSRSEQICSEPLRLARICSELAQIPTSLKSMERQKLKAGIEPKTL
jgi:hypothetical protein